LQERAQQNPQSLTVRSTIIALAVLIAFACTALPTQAQDRLRKRERTATLLKQWREICVKIEKDIPWDTLAEQTQAVADRAVDVDQADKLRDFADGMRQAAEQEASLPDAPSTATPGELVQLLIRSRLVDKRQGNSHFLVSRPLTFFSTGGTRWEKHVLQPLHEGTDPAIRIYKKGRVMIPALLDALDDMAATRSVYYSSSLMHWPVLLRRCDLAMALLEAISGCKFFRASDGMWFSVQSAEFRAETAESARHWWSETKGMTPLDARLWLLDRVSGDRAAAMINLLVFEGRTEQALARLRSLMESASNFKTQRDLAKRLAALGDPAGVEAVLARVAREGKIERDDAKFLAEHGDVRAYRLLARLMADDRSEKGRHRNSSSRAILEALRTSESRWAIPVLAEALGANDAISTRSPNERNAVYSASRADIAAEHIQRLTGRDFRYDRYAEPTLRSKAIERIRTWWEERGESLYGFRNASDKRAGAVR
jgi:hypothetical protein